MMRKLVCVLVVFYFVFLSGLVFADAAALSFSMHEESSAAAYKHNEEGVSHYNRGHYDVALKHF